MYAVILETATSSSFLTGLSISVDQKPAKTKMIGPGVEMCGVETNLSSKCSSLAGMRYLQSGEKSSLKTHVLKITFVAICSFNNIPPYNLCVFRM